MEAEEESRPSAARRLWGVARWLVLGALLALSFVVFMFGLASSFGHTGTTALRPMNVSEGTDKAIWDKFKAISTGGPTKGAPYGFDSARDKEALKEKIKGNIVDFDRRLTRELIYLAMGDNLFRQCGWNGQPSSQHDRIILKLDHDGSNPADPESSDLTYPEDKNIQSTSTLKRGVGARITEADYIRCSWESNGLPDPPCSPACPPLGTWWRHSRHKITFDPRGIAVFEKHMPEFEIYKSCCVKQVVCAVDYYPMAASACSEESACAPTCCPSAIESDPTINLCPGTDPCGVDYCSDAPECEDKLELSRLNPDWVDCDPE